MSIRPLAAALSAALLVTPLGAPAFAFQDAGVTTQEKEDLDPNKRICKRVKKTGSNVPSRLCMSRKAWDELAVQSEAAARDIVQRANQIPQQGN